MDIFCLVDDGRPLPPALQATVLAKYSRSPLSARDILKDLTAEEADMFHDKWTIGYGHASVAEMAIVTICLEGVSIIASKVVERMARAAYSEKSTRYQKFSKDAFILPPGAPDNMRGFAGKLYDAYGSLKGPVTRRCASLMGHDPNDPKALRRREVKARAFDNIRYLLPAGTGTNLGIVINVRDARDLVKMLTACRNPELREIGHRIRDEVSKQCPTLMKHTEPDPFLTSDGFLGRLSPKFSMADPRPYVDFYDRKLLPRPKDVEEMMAKFVKEWHGMSWEEFCSYMDSRPDHCGAPKAFSRVNVEFELMEDYGAFRDLQRHRKCEQWAEPLTTTYGYVVPDDILGSNLEPEYRRAMDAVSHYTEDVMGDVDLSQYVIPLGYLHRSLFRMDLQQLYYMVELRTKPHGHISYRRTAYEMFLLAQDVYPDIMKWCRAVKPTKIGSHF